MSSQFESGRNPESRVLTVKERLGKKLLESFKLVQVRIESNRPVSQEHMNQLETLRADIFAIKRVITALEIISLSQIFALEADIQSLHEDIIQSLDSMETLQSLSERIHTLQTSIQKSKNTKKNN